MYYYNLLLLLFVVYHKTQQDLPSQSGVKPSSQSLADLCLDLSLKWVISSNHGQRTWFKVSPTDSPISTPSGTMRMDLYPSV